MADFRDGQKQYRDQHPQGHHKGQHTLHAIGKETLEHYGASADNYAQHTSQGNYRMGDISVNTRDRLVDNAWHREVFTHPNFSAGVVLEL